MYGIDSNFYAAETILELSIRTFGEWDMSIVVKRRANCKVCFAGRYLPDLNPIESYWSEAKQKLQV